jgi:hypothetical protein
MFSLEVKQLEHETDLIVNRNVKNGQSFTSMLSVCWDGVVLNILKSEIRLSNI